MDKIFRNSSICSRILRRTALDRISRSQEVDENTPLLPSRTDTSPGTQEAGCTEYWEACYAGFKKCFEGRLRREATTQDTSASRDLVSVPPPPVSPMAFPLSSSEQLSSQDSPQQDEERLGESLSRSESPQGLGAGETDHESLPTFLTEAGREIRGSHWSHYRDDLPEASLQEIAELLQEENLTGKVLILEPSDHWFNCHSYTFTNGVAGWIDHKQVEDILRDQQYIQVSRQGTQVGDIVIYWNAEGLIKHSGVISKREGREITVTSKWGDHALMEHNIGDVLSRYGKPRIYHTELVETRILKQA